MLLDNKSVQAKFKEKNINLNAARAVVEKYFDEKPLLELKKEVAKTQLLAQFWRGVKPSERKGDDAFKKRFTQFSVNLENALKTKKSLESDNVKAFANNLFKIFGSADEKALLFNTKRKLNKKSLNVLFEGLKSAHNDLPRLDAKDSKALALMMTAFSNVANALKPFQKKESAESRIERLVTAMEAYSNQVRKDAASAELLKAFPALDLSDMDVLSPLAHKKHDKEAESETVVVPGAPPLSDDEFQADADDDEFQADADDAEFEADADDAEFEADADDAEFEADADHDEFQADADDAGLGETEPYQVQEPKKSRFNVNFKGAGSALTNNPKKAIAGIGAITASLYVGTTFLTSYFSSLGAAALTGSAGTAMLSTGAGWGVAGVSSTLGLAVLANTAVLVAWPTLAAVGAYAAYEQFKGDWGQTKSEEGYGETAKNLFTTAKGGRILLTGLGLLAGLTAAALLFAFPPAAAAIATALFMGQVAPTLGVAAAAMTALALPFAGAAVGFGISKGIEGAAWLASKVSSFVRRGDSSQSAEAANPLLPNAAEGSISRFSCLPSCADITSTLKSCLRCGSDEAEPASQEMREGGAPASASAPVPSPH